MVGSIEKLIIIIKLILKVIWSVFIGIGLVTVVALVGYISENSEFIAPSWIKSSFFWMLALWVFYLVGSGFQRLSKVK